jgi:transcriptional regulator with XRE-family HTH domain
MTIGERLRLIRKKNNMKLDETSVLFDVSVQTLSRYENDKRTPDNIFLEHFGKHFNVSGGWLLYGEPPIFKENILKKESRELFLELSASIGAEESGLPTESNAVDISLESIGNSPDHILSMLKYMIRYPEVSKSMLQFFYLFQKPNADKYLERD